MHAKLITSVALCAIFLTCTSRAPAQDASAKAFLVSVYHLYDKGGKGAGWAGPRAARYYHSSLLTLIKDDEKAAGPDNVPLLEGDPVCSCQEWVGIWDLKIDVQSETAERAVAGVSFALVKNAGKSSMQRTLTITLVPESGGWRIYNVVDNSDRKTPFDLRAELEKEIAAYAREKPAK